MPLCNQLPHPHPLTPNHQKHNVLIKTEISLIFLYASLSLLDHQLIVPGEQALWKSDYTCLNLLRIIRL